VRSDRHGSDVLVLKQIARRCRNCSIEAMSAPTHVRLAVVAIVAATFSCPATSVADDDGYRLPPAPIAAALAAPAIPKTFVSPTRDAVLLATPLRFPPVRELDRPVLSLAGLRIDTATDGLRGTPAFAAFTLLRVADGSHIDVDLPSDAHAGPPIWNADGSKFAFANATPDGTEPCVASVGNGSVRCYHAPHLNALFGDAIAWLPGTSDLLLHTRDDAQPRAANAPAGPVVREAIGRHFAPNGDLVRSTDAVAAAQFQRYASGAYVTLDAQSGRTTGLVAPGAYAGATVSPDGRYIAFDRYEPAASADIAWTHEAHRTIAIDRKGRTIAMLDEVPADAEVDPAVPAQGPRDVAWEPNAPSTLVWLRASGARDSVYALTLGSQDTLATNPRRILDASGAIRGMTFLAGAPLAIVRDYEPDSRTLRTFAFALEGPRASKAEAVGAYRLGDTFDDPGEPLAIARDAIFLAGEGYTTAGLRPFVDRIDLTTGARRRLFQSAVAPLETVLAMLDTHGTRFLVQRQSPTSPPDLYVRDLATHELRQLTHFPDPAPQLRALERRVVRYVRADGIGCSFTLYLPAGTRPNAKLPTLMWAYPYEFDDRKAASQNADFVQTFDEPTGPAAHLAALAGYAVLDDVSMPIVGDQITRSETLADQLEMDARAAIDKAVAIGVTDRRRVAIGGHSYGAFMTATLLAHTHLFRAGIARSGAYNRTLTPFGFQNEPRTYWQATDDYTKASPFAFAQHIDAPLLLIAGTLDENPATPALQSERMYDAIRGNGGTARLVLLPNEAHAYAALESVDTTEAETIDWLDRYVKP
jgi:dipeptidyl aminopeptidase/acylaminoacyl peptidase